jgi:hypothetical protein
VTDRLVPRYPIYVPSRGRYDRSRALTARCLMADGVPFRVVVEADEADAYAELVGADRVLVFPDGGGGSSVPVRNWIKAHATEAGYPRHWQLDDNIIEFRRFYRNQRIPCHAGVGLRVCEDFSDRYENVAVSGLNYQMFGVKATKPFVTNCHVYSCTLVNNAIPHGWRGRYNEDTDLCLQVLADGWCTVLISAFLANKMRTMAMTGGNTDGLYQGDGRLQMARSLERSWPYVVDTGRRFERPQHVVRDAWRKFDTPLKLRDGVDLAALPPVDEYGLRLVEKKPVRSPILKSLLKG